eukprot:CAMPEP_0179055932 /NCGR_PEP_ID=MMETSP0796-20121207/23553_1 /TAXON_ID=73915 /ORGANISM="Pyrodinium bahamense, Strain pbaha01" /LENGTH=248 /DNA_ID=CAMNT_0020752595 /DNA_START=20 /DNA_END=766 /DNA_ORIENTATION=-
MGTSISPCGAGVAARPHAGARRKRRGLALLAGAAALACAAPAFAGPGTGATMQGRAAARAAEGEPAPTPAPAPAGSSTALVKVTEENKMTTASLLGGLAGLLVGGVWVGGAAFAAASYLARKEDDDDVSKALKGVASGGLEVLNFGAQVNDKYMVTDKLGNAISSALESAKSGESKEAVSSVTGFFEGISSTIASVDRDIGIKDTLGQLTTNASELAFQAVDKAVELNREYKVTDQIAAKIEEATKSK